jgi:hypothetical protein
MAWHIYRMPLGAFTQVVGAYQGAWSPPLQDTFEQAIVAASHHHVEVDPSANAQIVPVVDLDDSRLTMFVTTDTKGRQVMMSENDLPSFAAFKVGVSF